MPREDHRRAYEHRPRLHRLDGHGQVPVPRPQARAQPPGPPRRPQRLQPFREAPGLPRRRRAARSARRPHGGRGYTLEGEDPRVHRAHRRLPRRGAGLRPPLRRQRRYPGRRHPRTVLRREHDAAGAGRDEPGAAGERRRRDGGAAGHLRRDRPIHPSQRHARGPAGRRLSARPRRLSPGARPAPEVAARRAAGRPLPQDGPQPGAPRHQRPPGPAVHHSSSKTRCPDWPPSWKSCSRSRSPKRCSPCSASERGRGRSSWRVPAATRCC